MRVRSLALTSAAATAMFLGMLPAMSSSAAETAGLPEYTITVGTKQMQLADDSIAAGRVVFNVVNKRGNTEVDLIQLDEGYSLKQFKHDAARGLDGSTVRATRRIYKHVTFFGGSDNGRWSVKLDAGTYYIINAERPLHTKLTVTGVSAATTAPGNEHRITAKARRFHSNGNLPHNGWTVFRNHDNEPHFLSMGRVKASTTRADVQAALECDQPSCQNPDWFIGPDRSIGIVSPGQKISFRHNKLPAGKYLVFCFMPDPDNHDMPHAFMGMYNFITLT